MNVLEEFPQQHTWFWLFSLGQSLLPDALHSLIQQPLHFVRHIQSVAYSYELQHPFTRWSVPEEYFRNNGNKSHNLTKYYLSLSLNNLRPCFTGVSLGARRLFPRFTSLFTISPLVSENETSDIHATCVKLAKREVKMAGFFFSEKKDRFNKRIKRDQWQTMLTKQAWLIKDLFTYMCCSSILFLV